MFSQKQPDNDAPYTPDSSIYESDSILVEIASEKHSPHKAAIYSAILPGLGQMYNKKWWKLPFVYGGFIATGSLINHNNNFFQLYRQAYADIIDNDPTTNSFKDLDIEGRWDWNNASQVQQFGTRLKRAQESARRNRDLAIICTIGVYALQIIDATVDAHFFDYDISDDISMNWGVTPMQYSGQIYPAVALQFNF